MARCRALDFAIQMKIHSGVSGSHLVSSHPVGASSHNAFPAGACRARRPAWCGRHRTLEQRPIRSRDPYAVSLAVHLNPGPKGGFHPGLLFVVEVIREVSSPWQSDTPWRFAPSRRTPWISETTGAIQSRAVSPRSLRTLRATPPSGRQSTERRDPHHPSEIQWWTPAAPRIDKADQIRLPSAGNYDSRTERS